LHASTKSARQLTKLLFSLAHHLPGPAVCAPRLVHCISGGASVRVRGRQSPLGDLAEQGIAMKSQNRGGLALVPPDPLEHAQDQVALELVERGAEGVQRRLPLPQMALTEGDLHGQIPDLDEGTLHERHGALDDVLELAHIAGPVIVRECAKRLGRHPGNALPELPIVLGDEVIHQEADVLAPDTTHKIWQDNALFFRRGGSTGRWRDVMTDDEVPRYRARIDALAGPDLIEWLHNGSLAPA